MDGNLALLSTLAGAAALTTTAAGAAVYSKARSIGLTRWVPTYLSGQAKSISGQSRVPLTHLDDGPIDVFIAICDHYEPEWGKPSKTDALARVVRWKQEYPALFAEFGDVTGRPPQHTFFFPQDEYQPEYLDQLAELCRAGYGDVDIHLHHDNDTPTGLVEKLSTFRDDLFHRHGLLRRCPTSGDIVYGFIHGNWALCNSRRDGRWCGVDHELPILLETGCYADFTMPSAPSDTQTAIINSIYYAKDTALGRCDHFHGTRASVGTAAPTDSLLIVQGPLLPDWSRRKFGFLPKIENGDLLESHPPSGKRISGWVNAGVTVAGKPNWRFVKLHTHGCKTGNLGMFLSTVMQKFHHDLAQFAVAQPNFRYHYVTAWEMAQLVHAAETGGDWSSVLNPGLLNSSVSTQEPGVPLTVVSGVPS